MSLTIRLLGAPCLERDSAPVAGPRGHKAWALLAYVLLCRGLPSRQRLAELFFSEADDPLGSLRWNLAELRRALGQPDALRGDPVDLALEPGTEVDLHLVSRVGIPDAEVVERLAGELLEGVRFATVPALDAWLVVERQRVAAAVQALLYERAQAELSAGHPDVTARVAQRLVEINPLEEEYQELLVRGLLAAGDRPAALACVEACEQLFQRELGTPPSRRLRSLLRVAGDAQRRGTVGGAAAARAQLETGRASIAAGAFESGLDCLKRACAEAESCGDDYLHARAQLALGSALVHAMVEHGEAAAVLHRAAEIARRIGAHAIAATAHRELAFVDVQAGRRERAAAWLDQAAEEAAGSDEELASISGVRGVNLSDAARYEEALTCFDDSVERAGRCGHRRQVAWSTSFIGRVHLLTGRLGPARKALERSLELAEEEKWIAFEPLPESLLAHVDLQEGHLDHAREALEHAFTIACQVSDPCWEGLSCRGLGLIEAKRGRDARAIAWLSDARTRCTRVANPYQWMHGWVLDAMCTVAAEDDRAAGWIDELASLAARTGMRELVVRAYLHRAGRGDRSALDAARLLGADIANPTLGAHAM